MKLSKRQESILEIVNNYGPITGERIAEMLSLTRATLRPDLAILTMSGLLDARPRVGYFHSGKSRYRVVAEKLNSVLVDSVKSVPIVVNEKSFVYDAVVTMFIEDVGTLFVVREGGLLEGVLSRKDLLKTTLGSHDIHNLPVKVVMTRMPNVVHTTPEETVWLAAKKIIEHEVDALPVVRKVPLEDGSEGLEVIGRLSKTNITRLFVELGEGY
ncbi:helix-turn-helix transcriptional regulator [Pelotomaculum propionicicum]|uniref:Transcriptional repressor CcpN n=1 Tax=Pelotomaculum propionicicum TaxID=258475 RepID=A0A4Y7RS59_9FIRM|nr:helix-turn-helix transcriptional regulator [Pelotomaculum propionicicum]NLI11709.1 helix-turn-helix transcriptional regulator [Peptococcaceae bacterium]TEB11549.1 Transcriptional repressor CcpN [Pelotomaculum propionicicum]